MTTPKRTHGLAKPALLVGVAVLSAVATALVLALNANVTERQLEAKTSNFNLVALTETTVDPAEWGKNFPRQYDGYLRTADKYSTKYGGAGSEGEPKSRLEDDPRLKTIFAGYAFSIDFNQRQGHAYMLDDQRTTKRVTERPQTGAREELLLAGAFAAKATWTFSLVWGAPYVGAEFSGASGDGDAANGVEGTFHQLFPTAHVHLGYMDLVAWQNVVSGHGVVGFRPWGAHLWLDVHHFVAWDPRAAWYAANGSVFVAADATRTDGVMGTEVDFNVTVPVFQNFAVAGNFSVFVPGSMAAARGTSLASWGFVSVRSQF